jgi:hypothetical protein
MTYDEGEKVIHRGKVYDFGYYSQTDGYVVIYEEGECNMQDSIAVPESEIRSAKWEEEPYECKIVNKSGDCEDCYNDIDFQDGVMR